MPSDRGQPLHQCNGSHEGEALNGFHLVIVLILNLLFVRQLVSYEAIRSGAAGDHGQIAKSNFQFSFFQRT